MYPDSNHPGDSTASNPVAFWLGMGGLIAIGTGIVVTCCVCLWKQRQQRAATHAEAAQTVTPAADTQGEYTSLGKDAKDTPDKTGPEVV